MGPTWGALISRVVLCIVCMGGDSNDKPTAMQCNHGRLPEANVDNSIDKDRVVNALDVNSTDNNQPNCCRYC